MLFWTIGPTLCFKESPHCIGVQVHHKGKLFSILKNIQILLSSKFIRFVIHCAAWTLKGFLNSELDMGSMCKIWKQQFATHSNLYRKVEPMYRKELLFNLQINCVGLHTMHIAHCTLMHFNYQQFSPWIEVTRTFKCKLCLTCWSSQLTE